MGEVVSLAEHRLKRAQRGLENLNPGEIVGAMLIDASVTSGASFSATWSTAFKPLDGESLRKAWEGLGKR